MGQSISRSSGQDQHPHQQDPRAFTSTVSSVNDSPSQFNHRHDAQTDVADSGMGARRLQRDGSSIVDGQTSSLAGKLQNKPATGGSLTSTLDDQEVHSDGHRQADSVRILDTSLTPQGSSAISSSIPGPHTASGSLIPSMHTTTPFASNAATTSLGQQTFTSTIPGSTRPTPAQIRSRRQRLAEGFINMRRRSSQRLSWAFSGGSRSSTPAASSQANCSTSPAASIHEEDQAPMSYGMASETISLAQQDTPSAALAPLEVPIRDPYRIMTPPPEDDVMFEERQRARRIIEEALEQLQTDLTRSQSSNANPASSSHLSIPPNNNSSSSVGASAEASQEPLSAIPSLVSPSSSNSLNVPSDDMQLDGPQVETSSLSADASTRRYAPLPRRSTSRSPTPSSTISPNLPSPSSLNPMSALNAQHATAGSRPATSQNATSPISPESAAAADDSQSLADLMVPRRILVQGIVASSPPPTPSLDLPLSNFANSYGTDTATDDLDSENHSSNGLWAELPGTTAVQPAGVQERSSNGGRQSSQDSEDRVWEDAMAEVLAQVPPHARRPTPRQRAETSERNLREQANLIGRLLSVAAAATAATLVPGITVNGAPVAGFGDSQGLDALSGSGIPLATASTSTPSNERSSPPRATPRPRSDSFGTFRTPRNAVQSGPPTVPPSTSTVPYSTPSSPTALQEILRNALAAAFRSANDSGPDGDRPAAPASRTAAGLPSFGSARPQNTSSDLAGSTSLLEETSRTPLLPSALATSPITQRTQPQRSTSDPFGRGTALAIPFANLQSEVPYVSGTNHAPGSFERFLADLQSDVSTAIVRSRASERAGATADATARPQREDASGLEEMRPLLADIEEVEADEPAAESASTPNESISGNAGPSSQPRQAQQFSFFRHYRFSPISLDELENTANPASRRHDSATGSHASTPVARAPPSAASSTTTAVAQSTDSTPIPAIVNSEDVVMEGTESAVPTGSSRAQEDQSMLQASQHQGSASAGQTESSIHGAAVAPTANVPARVAPSRQMVPMLLVGVRSASLQMAGNGTGSASSAASSVSQAARESAAGAASEGASGIGRTTPAASSTSTTTSDSPANPTPRDARGFVLWILGGLYPANHPIVIAPSLLGDDAMSYDELLRLAEVLGNVKPPTVTTEEINKSTLKTVKSAAVAELLAEGQIRDITAERCLVCLEDYEEDEDIRILNCRHCFHQPCVDTWLSTGANTCPACRTVGVEKAAEPSSETSTV